MSGTRVSLIVPVFRESEETLISMRNWMIAHCPPEVERLVVVADTDSCSQCIVEHDAVVLTASAGRAKQMNVGAAAASGDMLVFLHADTLLESTWHAELIALLRTDHCMWGAFSPCIAASGFIYRCAERWGRFRSRVLKIPFGDQTIFISAQLFRAVEGFDESVDFMEELDLATRLNRQGHAPILLSSRARTSNRRWKTHGAIAYSLKNLILFFLFIAGVPRSFLRLWYWKPESKSRERNTSKDEIVSNKGK